MNTSKSLPGKKHPISHSPFQNPKMKPALLSELRNSTKITTMTSKKIKNSKLVVADDPNVSNYIVIV